MLQQPSLRSAAADICYRYAHISEAEFAVTALSSIVVRCLGCLKLKGSGERATHMHDKLCTKGWIFSQHLTSSSSRLQMLLCSNAFVHRKLAMAVSSSMLALSNGLYSAVNKWSTYSSVTCVISTPFYADRTGQYICHLLEHAFSSVPAAADIPTLFQSALHISGTLLFPVADVFYESQRMQDEDMKYYIAP